MIEQIKQLVIKQMWEDKTGHGFDHIERVFNLAMRLAGQEGADCELVGAAALLHDVDDYKMVGFEAAKQLNNARAIMSKVGMDTEAQEQVSEIIRSMGYSNALEGIRPRTLEGRVVSDADMCDAIGAHGIVRSIVYAVSEKGSGTIFDKDLWPDLNITREKYNSEWTTHSTDNAINHFFEKLLKLKDMMLTKAGRREACKRHKIMVEFLRHFFQEEGLPDWIKLLK